VQDHDQRNYRDELGPGGRSPLRRIVDGSAPSASKLVASKLRATSRIATGQLRDSYAGSPSFDAVLMRYSKRRAARPKNPVKDTACRVKKPSRRASALWAGAIL